MLAERQTPSYPEGREIDGNIGAVSQDQGSNDGLSSLEEQN